MPLRPRVLFLLGITAGAAATWLVLSRDHEPRSKDRPLSNYASAPAPAHRPPSAPLQLPPRLASPEADAALAAYLALPPLPADAPPADFSERASRLRALLTALPSSHLPQLLSALVTRPGAPESRLRTIAFDIWIERDAPAVTGWLFALPPSDTFNADARRNLARRALLAWADTDFDAAYAYLSTAPDSTLATALARPLLFKLAETDPARALALAQARGPGFLAAARLQLFETWAHTDPAAALRALGNDLLSADKRDYRIIEALASWAAKAPAAALSWLDSQPALDPELRNELLQNLVWNAADQNRDLAPLAAHLARRTDLDNHTSLLGAFLNGWIRKNPAAANAWLDSLPDAAQRADIINATSTSTDLATLPQFLALTLRLPPDSDRDQRLTLLLGSWYEQNPDAALAWLKAQKDPSLAPVASRLEGKLVAALAQTDPAAALSRWNALADPVAKRAALPALAQELARTDPAAAARFAFDNLPNVAGLNRPYESLSPSERADFHNQLNARSESFRVLDQTLGAWYSKNPDEALAWAAALPDNSTREAAISRLSDGTGRWDAELPDRAAHADRLASLADSKLRDAVLLPHLQNWLRADRAAAGEWITNHDAVAPEQAAKLLSR